MRRMRHAGEMSVITLTLSAALILGGWAHSAEAQETVASPRQSLVVSNAPAEVGGVPTFGANAPVELMGGFLPVWTCPDASKNDPLPVVIANSTVLVIREGDGKVTSTTIPALGGLNLGLTVGVTGPTGPLTTGTYDVVYDECQDGAYSPDFDAKFTAAFRVIVPVDAPVIDLGQAKADAAARAKLLNQAINLWSDYNQLKGAVAKAKVYSSGTSAEVQSQAFKDGKDALKTYLSSATGYNVDSYLSPPTWLNLTLLSAQNYTGAFANDPPDANFGQVTTVASEPAAGYPASSADDAADHDLAAHVGVSARLTRALLQATERYQGATAAKDGHWALVHAREMRDLARALAAEETATAAAERAAAGKYRALPALDTDALAYLQQAAAGLTAGQVQALRNAGLPAAKVQSVQASLSQADLTVTAADVASGLDSLAGGDATWSVSLTAMAARAQTAVTALEADPNVGALPPTAQAGGPYTVAAGGALTLNAAATSGGVAPVTYRWDTNGDGTFGDATGVTTAAPVGDPGHRLVGVEVTDAIGQTSLAYTTVDVGGTAATLTGTPSESAVVMPVGRTQTFAVSGGSPVEWRLDGRPVGNAASYDYAPSEVSQVGQHNLGAWIGVESSQRAVRSWAIEVTGTDGDADDWTSNVDCDDTRSGVHPGATEVVGDGLDNDCDPATGDGGGPGTGAPTTVSTQPVPNGSFESPVSGTVVCGGSVPDSPSQLTAYSQADAASVPSVSVSAAHDGTSGLLVQTAAHTGGCGAAAAYQELPGLATGLSYDVDAWVRPDEGTQQMSVLFGWDHSSGSRSSETSVFVAPTATTLLAFGKSVSLPGLTFQTWHHVVLGVDLAARSATLTVDGVLMGSTPAGTGVSAATNATLYVGQSDGSPETATQFAYDEVKVPAVSGVPFQVAQPLGRSATRGEVFFDQTYVITTTASGDLAIAGSADGTAALSVDDAFDLTVTRADGTIQTMTHDFSGGCSGNYPEPPISLASFLGAGRNTVHLVFRDTCGAVLGNTAVWFMVPQATTVQYQTPTVPAADLTTTEGTATSTPLRSSTTPGATLTYNIAGQPAHGTATVSGSTLTYTPESGFIGTDTLGYTVTSALNSAAITSAPAVIRITVTPGTAPPSISPIDPLTTDGSVVNREVTARSPGTAILTLTAAGLPPFATFTDLGGGHGILSVDGAHASPGPYSASIKATSDTGNATASVSITVPGDRAPAMKSVNVATAYRTAVTVSPSAADPDGDTLAYSPRTPPAHGTVTQSGNAFTYVPEAGFSGVDAFAVGASDGSLSGTGMVTVTVSAPSSAPALDTSVSRDVSGSASKYVSPNLTTAKAGELLLAFVSADGPSNTAQSISKVTGGGLAWTLAGRTTDVWGTAEVWQARASGSFSAAVTAVPAKAGYEGSITVAAFTGAAAKVGATAAAVGRGAHPQVSLTTQRPTSLVWAAGHDWDAAKSRTPDAGQQIVHQYISTRVHDTFWTQRVNELVDKPATILLGASATAKSHWQLAAVEIPAG